LRIEQPTMLKVLYQVSGMMYGVRLLEAKVY